MARGAEDDRASAGAAGHVTLHTAGEVVVAMTGAGDAAGDDVQTEHGIDDVIAAAHVNAVVAAAGENKNVLAAAGGEFFDELESFDVCPVGENLVCGIRPDKNDRLRLIAVVGVEGVKARAAVSPEDGSGFGIRVWYSCTRGGPQIGYHIVTRAAIHGIGA